jgi:cytochrome c oxidase assembly protein subunit 15
VSHRYSTALFGILVVAQLLALRCYLPAKHSARRWVWATVVFTITEALIGRSLVKHGLVNESQSLSRMFVMPLHLVNTSLLLCSAVMTAESIRHGYSNRKKCDRATTSWVITIGIGLLILLTTGAIAALGSHLMPSESLVAGLQHDWQPDAHLAVRLRVLHPILGLLLPMGLWIAATYKTASSPPPPAFIATLRRQLYLAIAGAVLIGIATLGLLAPPWLKLVHLTMANVLVILTARLAYHSLRAH